MPAADAPRRGKPAPKPKARKAAAPARGDAQQGYGLKRANEFKQTNTFQRRQRAAIRANYDLSPIPERKQILKRLEGRKDMRAGAILKLNKDRRERKVVVKRSQAKHDAILDTDFKRARQFVATSTSYRVAKAQAAGAAVKDGTKKRQAIRAATNAAQVVQSNEKKRIVADRIDKPYERKIKAGSLWFLDQLSRPNSAISNTADYAAQGKNPVKGFLRGAAFKDRTNFGKVLKRVGAPKGVAAVAGFGLDVATDPLTYLSVGTAVPAKEAGKALLRKELKDGLAKLPAGASDVPVYREALAKGRARYNDAPASQKASAVKLGFRRSMRKGGQVKGVTVVPARANATVQRRLKEALPEDKSNFPKLLRKAPVPTRAGLREKRDRIGPKVGYNFRPRDVDPIAFEFVRQTARRRRAAETAGVRFAENEAVALRKLMAAKGIKPERYPAIVNAIEARNYVGLPPAEAEIAARVQNRLDTAGQIERGKGIRQTLGRGAAPRVPELTLDVKESAKALNKVRRARVTAERKNLDARQRASYFQGRAEVLSRNVGDTAGERAAGKATDANYAGGGQGVRQAIADVQRTAADVTAARQALKEAEEAHGKLVQAARGERSGQRLAERDLAQWAKEPEGYFPRYIKRDRFDDLTRADNPFPSSGGSRINSTDTKRRRNRGRLADMDPAKLDMYDLRIPESVGRRLADSGRNIALRDYQQRMGALGETLDEAGLARVIKADELGVDQSKRVMLLDNKGWVNLHDNMGRLDKARAIAAVKAGRELTLVDARLADLGEEFAQRGKRRAGSGEGFEAFDKLQGRLKTLQTVVNPGYHFTNLLGDISNSRKGGTKWRDYPAGVRLMAVERALDKLSRDPFNPKWAAAVKEATERKEVYGDLGELSDAEVVRLAIETGAAKMGFAGHELDELVAKNPDELRVSKLDGIRRVSERREDITRLALFKRALKDGRTPDDAADWVNEHLFDYGDLTPQEVAGARRVIPFYTFMARNTALQVKSLGRTPGAFANFEKLRDEAALASDLDPEWDRELRDFEQAGTPIPLPFKVGGYGTQVYPKLPLTDLSNVWAPPGKGLTGAAEYQFKNLIGRAGSVPKTVIEQGLQFNTFSRRKYEKARVPAPKIPLADPAFRSLVNWYGRKLGIDPAIRPIYDRRSGKMVPGWSWRFDQAARQIPALSAFANATTETRNDKPGGGLLGLSGYVLGPRVTQRDPRAMALNESYDNAQRLEEEADALRQYVPPNKPGDEFGPGPIKDLNKKIARERNRQYELTRDYDRPLGRPRARKRGKPKLGGTRRKNPYFGAK